MVLTLQLLLQDHAPNLRAVVPELLLRSLIRPIELGIVGELTWPVSAYDFLILDFLRREQPVPAHLRARLPALIEVGAVESMRQNEGP